MIRAKDAGKYKQFRKGIEQLGNEAVIQILRSDLRGDQAPVLAAVGPLQFDVVTTRLETEFNAPVTLDRLPYQIARLVDAEAVEKLAGQSECEVLRRDSDGEHLALFTNKWRMDIIQRKFPDMRFEAMPAGSSIS